MPKIYILAAIKIYLTVKKNSKPRQPKDRIKLIVKLIKELLVVTLTQEQIRLNRLWKKNYK